MILGVTVMRLGVMPRTFNSSMLRTVVLDRPFPERGARYSLGS